MPSGFLQLDRAVDSIRIGVRHRRDLGDIDALAASIAVRGLPQPITITPDGALVCGLRRLAALQRLGWRTTNVWIRSGLSDGMHHLLAEQDENNLRKSFSPLEAEELYRELKILLAEDAERHAAGTRFGAGSSDSNAESDERGERGVPDSGTPRKLVGDAARQAAKMVTGTASYMRMEQIGRLRRLCEDPDESDAVRKAARAAIERISAGHPVDPLYRAVIALSDAGEELNDGDGEDDPERPSKAELDAMALASLERTVERVNRPRVPKVRATPNATAFRTSQQMWRLTFSDLDGWLDSYDPCDVARWATAPQWASFDRVVDQFQTWAARAQAARDAAREDAALEDIEGRP
jgi:ParB family chromosome partitioning protein